MTALQAVSQGFESPILHILPRTILEIISIMEKTAFSALGRVLYFTMNEQRVIFESIRLYLELNPDSQEAKTIYEDFYRNSFLKE